MKVILTQDFGRDKKGSIVEVSDSFGRNVVIKKGLGVEATPENLNALKLQQKHEDKLEQERVEKATEQKNVLDKAEVAISVKVGADGKMFGSVTNSDIAKAIKDKFNIEINKKSISGGVLNSVGTTEVKIKLHKCITAKLVVKLLSN